MSEPSRTVDVTVDGDPQEPIYFNVTQDEPVTRVDLSVEVGPPGPQGPPGDPPESHWNQYRAGMTVIDRRTTTSNVSMTNGLLRLTFFTAVRTETIRNVAISASTTAAVGTTLARIGLYSVDGDPFTVDGDLHLIGATASDVTLLATANSRYVRALLAPVDIVKGSRYAFALLGLWTTAPSVAGVALSGNPGNPTTGWVAQPPRLAGGVAGSLDLIDPIPASALTGLGNGLMLGELLP